MFFLLSFLWVPIVQKPMFLSRGERDLGVAFQTHPGRQASSDLAAAAAADSILKSRDITLTTKVCLFNAMVFPVVIYGCESWTVKKAER